MPHPATRQPTQHALLIAWGHFAQSLDLLAQLHTVPIPQKTVHHTPQAKLLTLLIALLAGSEYLADVSLGPTPIARDPALAAAWDLPALASASGISRTLQAMLPATLATLQAVLDQITAPFLGQALAALHAQGQPLQLDVDLTGRPVSATSTSYPNAAFGYMDQAICLGYQVAVVCLQPPQWGRQWLVGQHHPGDMVSAPCLLGLLTAAEARLGCHPRRRPELVRERAAVVQARLTHLDQQLTTAQEQFTQTLARRAAVHSRWQQIGRQILRRRLLDPAGAPTAMLLRDQQRQDRLAAHEAHLTSRLHTWRQREEQIRVRQQVLREHLRRLHERAAALATENAAQPEAPVMRLRMDAGFCSGANLTALLEWGYEVETKAAHPAVLAALCERTDARTAGVRVGKNAAMVAWADYRLRGCPYPLTVGLQRFQVGTEEKYAVLVRSPRAGEIGVPDVRAWFHSYNARQSVEAGIKQAKTVFKVQRLWSRSAVGMQVQVALTLFAANFVGWAQEWVAARTVVGSAGAARMLTRPKQAVRVGANSPGVVEQEGEQVRVRFSESSSLAGTVIHLAGPSPVQLAFPFGIPF